MTSWLPVLLMSVSLITCTFAHRSYVATSGLSDKVGVVLDVRAEAFVDVKEQRSNFTETETDSDLTKSAFSPMEQPPFRECIDNIEFLDDGDHGYTFFQARQDTGGLSMKQCIESELCGFNNTGAAMGGDAYQHNSKAGDIVERCFKFFASGAHLTTTAFGNLDRGMALIPFLGAALKDILDIYQFNVGEALKHNGAASIQKRADALLKGSSHDITSMIADEIHDCLTQAEIERLRRMVTSGLDGLDDFHIPEATITGKQPLWCQRYGNAQHHHLHTARALWNFQSERARE